VIKGEASVCRSVACPSVVHGAITNGQRSFVERATVVGGGGVAVVASWSVS
jgi:hypothetical protein